MAKNSNKLLVLTRRKLELDHAIRHGFAAEKINLRAEKLRAAALGVLKKYRNTHCQWHEMRAQWENLTIEEIVELSSKWGRIPRIRDVHFGRA